jgi:hypothetical protein
LAYLSLLGLTDRSREYQNIQLIAFKPYGLDSFDTVVEALEILRTHDPRRFKLVKKHIRRIVFWDFKGLGFYTPIGRVCGLRSLCPPTAPNRVVAYGYAAILIHEATHGFFHRLRVAPTRTNLKRMEKLANREEARFLRKFPEIRHKVSIVYGYADRKRR